jgi:cytochrome P450 family 619
METGNTPPIHIWPFLKYLPDSMSEWRGRAKKLSQNMFTLYQALVNEETGNEETGAKRDSLIDTIRYWRNRKPLGLIR